MPVRPLLAALSLVLAGCAGLFPQVPTETELTYLTRGTPSAALDSVAAWATLSDDLVADRAGATLTIRDRRPGQDNVATLTAERRRDGVVEVTVRNRYLLARDARDLSVAMALGSLGGARYLVPLADPDSARAPCLPLDDWLTSDDLAGDRSDPSLEPPEEVEVVAPVLIGGLAAMQGRVQYPELMRRAGVEGVVLVQFVVGEAGAVECAEAVSSPHPELSASALAAVRASAFEPGTVGGEPASVRFMVPLTFRLR